jgi:hypothetical protein
MGGRTGSAERKNKLLQAFAAALKPGLQLGKIFVAFFH